MATTRRPALREWKNKGCVGEDNKGFATARPGDGCGPEVADLSVPLTDLCQGQDIVSSDVTSTYAVFAVIGPQTEALLRRLTSIDVRPTSFPINSC